MGGFVVTSNPLTDRAVLQAMEPRPVITFTQLLEQTQKTLDALSKSSFFCRYISEALKRENAEGEEEPFLQVSQSYWRADLEGEWLILTPDYQLKFWLEGQPEIYAYSDRVLPPIDQNNSTYQLLQKMQLGVETFRTLISLFGAPSFTSEDVEKELSRNGTIHLIDVLDTGPRHRTRHEMNLRRRVQALQFDLTAEVRDYRDDFIIPDSGQFIIIVDLDPSNVDDALYFFSRLTPRQKRHLWTTRNDEGAGTIYRNWGFSMETIKFPSVAEAHALSDTELLGMLSNMFNDQ